MQAKVTIPALQQMKREGRKSAVGVVAWDYPRDPLGLRQTATTPRFSTVSIF